jgi:hypothetical protein
MYAYCQYAVPVLYRCDSGPFEKKKQTNRGARRLVRVVDAWGENKRGRQTTRETCPTRGFPTCMGAQ